MYARHGAQFLREPDVRRQFEQFIWYVPMPGLTLARIDREFSRIESQNRDLLSRLRDQKRPKSDPFLGPKIRSGAMASEAIYLDTFTPTSHSVGYGTLGTGGSLGYEAKTVKVHGGFWPHAFSAHPPARVRFQLDGHFCSFRCKVGLNDDVPFGRSHADFVVLADDRPVATANFVVSGEMPRLLCADLMNAGPLSCNAKFELGVLPRCLAGPTGQ